MTETISNETIMQNVRDGNLTEMSVLFERYHLRLYNFFIKMGLQNDISQDLTQNLFYRMIKYRHSYKPGNSVKSWMYQIARNLHADYCYKRKKSADLVIPDNAAFSAESIYANISIKGKNRGDESKIYQWIY